MTIRKWCAVLLAIVMLGGCAAAETGMDAPVQTGAPVDAPADMTPEEIRAFIEAVFAAAVGTSVEEEKALRETMTDEEILARNAENAEYRAKALPWLLAVFRPEVRPEELMPTPEPTQEPTPLPSPEPTPEPTHLPVPEPTAQETAEPAEEMPVYTTYDSYEVFGERESGREYLALMERMGADSREKCLLLTQEICGMWMDEVDHERLSRMNGDYRCWIYAPATQMDYPSHYLKRMFNGERNSAGTLFIDYRNLPGFLDPNTLIYGHHMRNDSMFGALTDYVEQSYYEGHPVMLMMSAEEIFLLEVFAGYTTSDKDHCYDIAISGEEDMAAFIREAERKSDFDSGVLVKTTDRLVTLSTCSYLFEDARYIVIGRIAAAWDAEMEETEDAIQED